MDAFELLKKDHKKVSQLFKEVEAASGQTKKQIFSRLKNELDVHAQVEERIFYPALENQEEARDITLEAYEEHKVVKDLLGELASGNAPDDEWDAKLTVLKENVEHHVEEEEGELFSKARKVLSRRQIEELGVEMEAAKAGQQDNPAAAESNAPAKKKVSNSAAASTTVKESKTKESPGVLKRLASLVGLGGSSTSKKSPAKRRSPTKGAKASGGKKTATKTAAKKRGGKSQAARTAKPAKTAKKATKKSTPSSTESSRSRGAATKSPTRGSGQKKAPGRSAKKRGRTR